MKHIMHPDSGVFDKFAPCCLHRQGRPPTNQYWSKGQYTIFTQCQSVKKNGMCGALAVLFGFAKQACYKPLDF